MVRHPDLLTRDPNRLHVCFRCGHCILANEEHIQAMDLRLHPECAQQALEELR